MVHCEIKTNTEKVSCRGNPLMKRDVRIEKSTSNREHLLQIGILFSRNAKKTHRDESILQGFFLCLKKITSQY